MTSEVSARARALVAARLPQARGLGIALADLIDDPEPFVGVLTEGFESLADDAYAAEQERVAPGSGEVIGVRWPLVRAVARQLEAPLREGSPASALWLAQRLAISEVREIRLFSLVPLERSLPADPERTWQVLRRLGRRSTDWISVDALADVLAQGIVNERFRWAELEQLVYSTQAWERRLVGSTVARLPHRLPKSQRTTLRTTAGLTLIKSLMGDADQMVQKALGWALRSWSEVDPVGVTRLLMEEADHAARTGDGHRAWVVRDALSLQPQRIAAELRGLLASVRRESGAPSTSSAAGIAAKFARPDDLADLADRAVDQQGERQDPRLARAGR